jgi:hypothetical protein
MVDLSKSTEFKPIGNSKYKKQIIICETKRDYKNFIMSLKYRYDGNNPYLPNYVINRSGEVYIIMEPHNYSMFMNNHKLDKNSIIICLENFGWLEKKPIENIYLNWIGDIYKKEVFERKWRDKNFWHPYDSEKQIESLVDLLKNLCEVFEIPKVCAETNVILTNPDKFKGILSKSSFNMDFKDVNPSFDFKRLQKLLSDD